jgi:hypothetical protein
MITAARTSLPAFSFGFCLSSIFCTKSTVSQIDPISEII